MDFHPLAVVCKHVQKLGKERVVFKRRKKYTKNTRTQNTLDRKHTKREHEHKMNVKKHRSSN